MAQGIKDSYFPKGKIVVVADTTVTIALAVMGRFKLVLITPDVTPPTTTRVNAYKTLLGVGN